MSKSCGCGENTKLGATVQFHCQTCSTVTNKFSVKNPLKAAAIATVLAFGGSQLIGKAVTANRYPLSTEYNLLDSCINSSTRALTGDQYKEKKDICLCALEDTMNEISLPTYWLKDEDYFLDALAKNVIKCK